MAKLEIELSEYDVMREARKTAEARVEELKQENKELRNSSKVIIRREIKHLIPQVDMLELAEAIQQRISHACYINRMTEERRPVMSLEGISFKSLADICIAAWKAIPKRYSTAVPTDVDLPSKTDTLVGFEDIRLKIEDMLKEQFEEEHKQALNNLQSEKESYEKKHAQLTKEFEAIYRSKIDSLEEKTKRLEEDNNSLFEKLREASKSHEEKLAEAEKKVCEAQEELSKLQGRKRHWWQK